MIGMFKQRRWQPLPKAFIMRKFYHGFTLGVLFAAVCALLHPTYTFAQNPSGITTPAGGSTIGGDVAIHGTAVIDPFQKYELHYKLEPSNDDAFIYFDGGTTPIVNGQLGIWRASGLPPGIYSIRLRVVKTDGNYAEFYARDLSVNQGPTSTPTETVTPTSSEPTLTPIPSATFTPGIQPTPQVGQVIQPPLSQDQSTPIPTVAPIVAGANNGAAPAGVISTTANVNPGSLFQETENQATTEVETNGLTRELGEALALDKMRTYFLNGIRYSAALFIAIGAVFASRRILGWVWTQYR